MINKNTFKYSNFTNNTRAFHSNFGGVSEGHGSNLTNTGIPTDDEVE